jgi:hypothetical protein
MAKGRYQLSAPHYFPGDVYLNSGDIVGDGTPYPVVGPPSFNMTAMDEAAQAELNEVSGKDKPEMPTAVLNMTGNNPAQGPRPQFGSVSAPGGVHGSKGLAEPPKPVGVTLETAKAMAVQAAMIPKEELDKAIEQERARLADLEAEKEARADRAAAVEAAKIEATKVEVKKVETPPPPPPPAPAPKSSW